MQGGFHCHRPLAVCDHRAILGPMTTRLRRITLPKGARVFSPGEPCPGFVLLDSGTIRVSLSAENGREVVLYRVQPGDVCLQTFSCLINHTTYRAEGVAETDLSGTLLPPEMFHARMAEDADFRADIFRSVARRFQMISSSSNICSSSRCSVTASTQASPSTAPGCGRCGTARRPR
jgi:CRP-like cAMP-binding protein